MSSTSRIALIAAAVVIAVVAFIALRPGDSGSDKVAAGTTTTQATAVGTTPAMTATTAAKPAPPAAPTVTTIRVVGKKPQGGLKKITVKQGETIRLKVTSDQPEHVHMHGYDIEKEVGPGTTANFSVPATITGIFEIELEDSAVQIAKLTVQPK